jgi:hypothetical protein
MSFPELLKAKPFQQKANSEEFSVEALFDPADLEFFQKEGKENVDLRIVMAALAKEEWPDVKNVNDEVKAGRIFWPVKDGNTKKAELEAKDPPKNGDHYEGKKFMRFKAKADKAPQLRYIVDGKFVTLDRHNPEDVSKINAMFVGGNYAFAEINVRPTLTPQGKFMTLYLNKVCYMRDGVKLGGGPSLMDDVQGADIRGGEANYDPTEGLDDEIPF